MQNMNIHCSWEPSDTANVKAHEAIYLLPYDQPVTRLDIFPSGLKANVTIKASAQVCTAPLFIIITKLE